MSAPFDGQNCKLSNPHSNAVVDIDGDCLAGEHSISLLRRFASPAMNSDVVMICDEEGTSNMYFQVWTNDKKGGFTLIQLGRLPAGFQSMVFADMDRDGTIDMVFTTCDSVSSSTGLGSECEIHVVYNQQLPLCESTTNPDTRNGRRVCRRPEELCTVDTNFKFDLSDRDNNAVSVFP